MFRRFMSNITMPSPQNSILFWSMSSLVKLAIVVALEEQSYFTPSVILQLFIKSFRRRAPSERLLWAAASASMKYISSTLIMQWSAAPPAIGS